MITKFDSMYAGHVDMDNLGYGGTAVNDRRFTNEHLLTAFDKGEAIAQTMDRTGYNTFWLAEHHFQPEGYECLPNIILYALHLAHKTTNIKIGCAFNIAPMWHPLRLAEDFATVDYLTGGRVIFGVGRGYHTREVETFGAPLRDQPGNRDLFEEQVEIVLKAFNEESFSHRGKYYEIPPPVTPYRGYTLEKLTVVPRPVNRPVECWQAVQSATRRGLDFMAKHDIKGIIGGGVSEGGAMSTVMEAFRDALVRAGRTDAQLGEDMSIGFHFFMDDSTEKAIQSARKYYEENLKMFGPLRLVRSLTDEQIEVMSDPRRAPHAGLPNIEVAVQGGGFLAGSPEEITAAIQEVEEKYPGLDRVGVGMPVGTPQGVMLEQLGRFAAEVIPKFRARVEEPIPAD